MEIKKDFISSAIKKLENDAMAKIAMNAATRMEIQDLAINREVVKSVNFSFSNEIEVAPEATAQQKVGVCWMFAAMNLIRSLARKKMNLVSFEFSGPYLMFWDKLEKANYFLHKMLEFRDRVYDDRVLVEFLNKPIPDGGDWYMFVNLVKKYGMVPAEIMKHSSFSMDSEKINELLGSKLRYFASSLRKMNREGKSLKVLEKAVKEYMEEIFRMLVICFGTPPSKFDFGFRDDKKKFHKDMDITPSEFYQKYVGANLDDYCCLWSCPLDSTPYNTMYTVEHTRKMVGGNRHLALNVDFETFKKSAVDQLKSNQACLFSCDVGKESLRKDGLLIKGIHNYDLLFQTDFYLEKSARIEIFETKVTHCMLLVGVDLVKGKPVKFKVENSWGKEVGKNGYFVMSDGWFDEHVYQLVTLKKFLKPALRKLLTKEPVVLPYWHPIG